MGFSTTAGVQAPQTLVRRTRRNRVPCPETEVLSREMSTGTVAAEARLSMAKQQFQGRLPRVGGGPLNTFNCSSLIFSSRWDDCELPDWRDPKNLAGSDHARVTLQWHGGVADPWFPGRRRHPVLPTAGCALRQGDSHCHCQDWSG